MDANLRVRVIVLYQGSLLLHPPDGTSGEGGGCWTLPGGGLEAGETLAECAAREVREETGVAVTVGEVAFLRERPWVLRHMGRTHKTGLCLEIYFHAIPTGGEIIPRPESASAAPPRWVSLAKAGQMPLWPPELQARVGARLDEVQAPSADRSS